MQVPLMILHENSDFQTRLVTNVVRKAIIERTALIYAGISPVPHQNM